jgi:hypothetical protein
MASLGSLISNMTVPHTVLSFTKFNSPSRNGKIHVSFNENITAFGGMISFKAGRGRELGFKALCLVGRRQEEALLDRFQKM